VLLVDPGPERPLQCLLETGEVPFCNLVVASINSKIIRWTRGQVRYKAARHKSEQYITRIRKLDSTLNKKFDSRVLCWDISASAGEKCVFRAKVNLF
jgi:hypothetical protein